MNFQYSQKTHGLRRDLCIYFEIPRPSTTTHDRRRSSPRIFVDFAATRCSGRGAHACSGGSGARKLYVVPVNSTPRLGSTPDGGRQGVRTMKCCLGRLHARAWRDPGPRVGVASWCLVRPPSAAPVKHRQHRTESRPVILAFHSACPRGFLTCVSAPGTVLLLFETARPPTPAQPTKPLSRHCNVVLLAACTPLKTSRPPCPRSALF